LPKLYTGPPCKCRSNFVRIQFRTQSCVVLYAKLCGILYATTTCDLYRNFIWVYCVGYPKKQTMWYAVCSPLYLKTYAIQPIFVSPHYSVLKSLVDKIPFSSPIGRPFRYLSGSVSRFPNPTSRHGLVALRRDLWLQKGLLVSSIDIR
jgi:hypothetical protein